MDRQASKADLRRLVMARFDIRAALDLCGLLRDRGGIDGDDWGTVAWGLWTGVVCSYARPFKRATLQLKDPQWATFPTSDLDACHASVIDLRDTVFAHNDASDARTVLVLPPGSWTADGSATEEQTVLSINAIPFVEALCRFQLDRIEPRVQELVAAVCDGVEYGEGAMIYLSDIPDRG